MKQVVGGLFSGFLNNAPEWEIDLVDILLEKARGYRPDNIKPRNSANALRAAAGELTRLLRENIGLRTNAVLKFISQRLLDPEVALRHDFFTNNCQNLCDNLLQKTPFSEPVVDSSSERLFAFSFVVPPHRYAEVKATSKFDIPIGLTEEYLLDYRFGRHNDTDIIDCLQEYWYDFGGFAKHLYPHQNLFPWDCTPAFNPTAGKCNECSIFEHVWSFPFDSFSIAKHHLMRPLRRYPPATDGFAELTPQEWLRNRLSLLLAQDSLTTGVTALSDSRLFRNLDVRVFRLTREKKACRWLSRKNTIR